MEKKVTNWPQRKIAHLRDVVLQQEVRWARAFNRANLWLTDPYVRSLRSRLALLSGAYSGQRCFIMGNGPSLNKMDLSVFNGEFVWASNKAYLLFERVQWRPSFYIAVDTRVVPDIAHEIETRIYTIPEVKCFFPFEFREHQTLNSNSKVYWYHVKYLTESRDPYDMFTTRAQDWVSSVTTVTIAALQLAVHLGFNPIYLIGCDTDYRVPDTVVFEGSEDSVRSTQNDDLNHFDASYFGKNSRWHQPRPENMILHYAKAKEVCDALGVKVFNATVGGKLEVFPRVDYQDLFQGSDG